MCNNIWLSDMLLQLQQHEIKSNNKSDVTNVIIVAIHTVIVY